MAELILAAGAVGGRKNNIEAFASSLMKEFKARLKGVNNLTKRVLDAGARYAKFERDRVWDILNDDETFFVKDHTLEELRAMGYPYSRMRPTYAGLHENMNVFHIQHSGGGTKSNVGFSIFDGLVTDDDDENRRYTIRMNGAEIIRYWQYVQFGTSRMVPRGSLAKQVQDKYGIEIRENVKKRMRKYIRDVANRNK